MKPAPAVMDLKILSGLKAFKRLSESAEKKRRRAMRSFFHQPAQAGECLITMNSGDAFLKNMWANWKTEIEKLRCDKWNGKWQLLKKKRIRPG